MSRLIPILVLALSFLVTPGTAVAWQGLYWLPKTVSLQQLDKIRTDLLYEGESGRLVGVKEDSNSKMVALGGERVYLNGSEGLYVYVLEDARRAEFQYPAKVLVRAGHEVLVAMPKEAFETPVQEDICATVPCLKDESALELKGVRQPIYVSLLPIAWPETRSQLRDLGIPPEPDPNIAAMLNQVTEDSYQNMWHPLEDFVTRYTFADPNNNDATDWVYGQFSAITGLDVAYHHYEQGGHDKWNVVATLHGRNPEVVYVTAHFDAISGTPHDCAPGADDNASGVVAVLEAARVMSQFPGGFTRTLKFAAFNGEEQGLRGSQAYVADIVSQGEQIAGVYNVEMIAYRGNDPGLPDLWMFKNAASLFLAETLVAAIDLYLPGLIEPVVGDAHVVGSDHASFWNYGYPAILVVESRRYGGELTPWYHTCEDLIEKYDSHMDFIVNNTRAIIAAAAIVACDSGSATSIPLDEQIGTTHLDAPVPNPMVKQTTFSFALTSARSVRLDLYSLQGRRVRTLIDGDRCEGKHHIDWDGRDNSGNRVGPGVYFAQMQLAGTKEILKQKVIVVR